MERNANLIGAEVKAGNVAQGAADIAQHIAHASYDETGTYARCVIGTIDALRRALDLESRTRRGDPSTPVVDHMAGKLPKALLTHCLQQGWLRRHAGERALEVTPLGRKHLASLLPSVNAL